MCTLNDLSFFIFVQSLLSRFGQHRMTTHTVRLHYFFDSFLTNKGGHSNIFIDKQATKTRRPLEHSKLCFFKHLLNVFLSNVIKSKSFL